MEKITIEINTVNASFEEIGESFEVARILRKLADKLEEGEQPKKLMDYNGNGVGKVEYK